MKKMKIKEEMEEKEQEEKSCREKIVSPWSFPQIISCPLIYISSVEEIRLNIQKYSLSLFLLLLYCSKKRIQSAEAMPVHMIVISLPGYHFSKIMVITGHTDA